MKNPMPKFLAKQLVASRRKQKHMRKASQSTKRRSKKKMKG